MKSIVGLMISKKNLRIDFQYVAEDRIEFDLIGADASIANAFRRILISEVSAYLSSAKAF